MQRTLASTLARALAAATLLAACAPAPMTGSGGGGSADVGTVTPNFSGDGAANRGDGGRGGVADAGAPDTSAPDAGTADTSKPDSGMPDTGAPDTGMPDAGVPDTGVPDTGAPDTAMPDTGTPDTGVPDTSTSDAAAPDSGAPDAGPGPTVKPGDLVITEIHPDSGAVADAVGEWFELRNMTNADIDLRGLSLVDKSGKPHVIKAAQPVWVMAGGHAVLGASADSKANGGVDVVYAYSGVTLANSGSKVAVLAGATLIDEVAYQDGAGGWPKVTKGATLSLNPAATDSAKNDAGGAWCLGVQPYGDGDLGTPGQANPTCKSGPPLVSGGALLITEILFDPAAVGDSAGEWIELYNPTAAAIDIEGWVVSDKSSKHTIASGGSLAVPAKGYLVLGINADPSVNGGAPVAYAWKGIAISNSSSGGRIALSDKAGKLVDEVVYQTTKGKSGWPGKVSGVAYQLAPAVVSASGNDAGSAWCLATQVYGKGDKGTPGKANDASCTATP